MDFHQNLIKFQKLRGKCQNGEYKFCLKMEQFYPKSAFKYSKTNYMGKNGTNIKLRKLKSKQKN